MGGLDVAAEVAAGGGADGVDDDSEELAAALAELVAKTGDQAAFFTHGANDERDGVHAVGEREAVAGDDGGCGVHDDAVELTAGLVEHATEGLGGEPFGERTVGGRTDGEDVEVLRAGGAHGVVEGTRAGEHIAQAGAIGQAECLLHAGAAEVGINDEDALVGTGTGEAEVGGDGGRAGAGHSGEHEERLVTVLVHRLDDGRTEEAEGFGGDTGGRIAERGGKIGGTRGVFLGVGNQTEDADACHGGEVGRAADALVEDFAKHDEAGGEAGDEDDAQGDHDLPLREGHDVGSLRGDNQLHTVEDDSGEQGFEGLAGLLLQGAVLGLDLYLIVDVLEFDAEAGEVLFALVDGVEFELDLVLGGLERHGLAEELVQIGVEELAEGFVVGLLALLVGGVDALLGGDHGGVFLAEALALERAVVCTVVGNGAIQVDDDRVLVGGLTDGVGILNDVVLFLELRVVVGLSFDAGRGGDGLDVALGELFGLDVLFGDAGVDVGDVVFLEIAVTLVVEVLDLLVQRLDLVAEHFAATDGDGRRVAAELGEVDAGGGLDDDANIVGVAPGHGEADEVGLRDDAGGDGFFQVGLGVLLLQCSLVEILAGPAGVLHVGLFQHLIEHGGRGHGDHLAAHVTVQGVL